ncbi:lysophospholipid acyltransferase family protein [Rhodococcus sp. NBC_00294]|uniref:lysophospholipid acyltransferase family protein n=1 Tax=Rhodococcus sp. NBC_00294 TaxID=2976004 RepID=UPI002E2DEE60|nr:lysophospholipid acyltransferase family protein [Rhodococcus sp. NBC_00294]
MTTHAWMPASPCGTGCHPAVSATVGTARVVVRCVLVAVLLAVVPLLLAGRVLPAGGRGATARAGARGLLGALGVRVTLVGDRTAEPTGVGTLVVANHVSWTDVLVLAACFPCRFVARADLVDWPVLGLLARIVRVVPIARERLRSLPGTVDEVTEALRSGATVVVFPEGTTWCGTAYGSFRPALFQAAIDAGAVVRPIAVTYRDVDHRPTTATAFVGDETIGESMSRILRLKGVRAAVRVCEDIAPIDDRRLLARSAELAVRRHQDETAVPPLRVTRTRLPRRDRLAQPVRPGEYAGTVVRAS